MSSAPPLPRWADVGLLPIINLAIALVVSGLVVLAVGEDPLRAIDVMIRGAFFYEGSLGYTLYYTTNFIFTGLAVSVAFHALLFNIGGEGQAYIGGLGRVWSASPWTRSSRGSSSSPSRSPPRRGSAPAGRSCPPGSRPIAAATSSSPPSCSTSSPRG